MKLDLSRSAPEVAAQLIGYELRVSDSLGERGGIIVETEAYTADDPASHSFRGKTMRNEAMFLPAGTLYIYKIYGIHYCLNIVCGSCDGQAVLIRALRPNAGIAYMQQRRGTKDISKLCSGPAKLVQALGITPELNKTHINNSIIRITAPKVLPKIYIGSRIGISKAVDKKWRFFSR